MLFLFYISFVFAIEHIIVTDNTIDPFLVLKTNVKNTQNAFVNEVTSHDMYHFGLVYNLDDSLKEHLLYTKGVVMIVPNSNFSIAQWSLDRINQPFGIDGDTKSDSDGNGTDIYIMDTGVMSTHISFGSRVQLGINILTNTYGNTDCNGHGTHVASLAAGVGYGVATAALIYPVNIMSCTGTGTVYSLAKGVTWIINQMTITKKRSIVNLSIESNANPLIDALVTNLFKNNVIVVVAAANFNEDACNYSPARAVNAVTVGGTSNDDSKFSGSNYGKCVDVYAPGDKILGAGIKSNIENVIKSGTSMSCALVSGVIATLIQQYPSYSNIRIVALLLIISVPIKTIANDIDCLGTIPGVPFVQLIINNPNTILKIPGNILKSDFLYWSQILVPVDNIACITFKARVSSSTIPLNGAFLRILISTSVMSMGISQYLTTLDTCKDTSVQWYVIENTEKQVTVTDYLNILVNAGNGIALTSTYQTFYVSIQSDKGMSIQFGNIVQTNVDAFDSTCQRPIQDFKYISFSTNVNYNLEITQIEQCNKVYSPTTSVKTPAPEYKNIPTNIPSNSEQNTPSTVPSITNTNSLSIQKDQINAFFIWGWPKPIESIVSCIGFDFGFQNGGVVLIASATQLLDFMISEASSNGSTVYEFRIGKITSDFFKNGVWIITKKNSFHLPRVKTVSVKVYITSQILIKANRRGVWVDLVDFQDDIPVGMGTGFSIGSNIQRNFNNINVC
jgi:hypothetical protein